MYNKIFTKILDSSIWLETHPTRIVWFTFLAAMDENGFAQFASIRNLSHRARVSDEECEAAITCLEGPDPNSSDPDHEGRRIERVQGGWVVLNCEKYRTLVTRAVAQEKTRQRVARFREKKRLGNAGVTAANESVTPSEASAESDTESLRSMAPEPPGELPFNVPPKPEIPYAMIIADYHDICVSLPRATKLTDARRGAIRARFFEAGDNPIEWFRELFRKAEASDFVSGRSGKWGGADFDWLMTPSKSIKVIEGSYDNKRGSAALTPAAEAANVRELRLEQERQARQETTSGS